MPGTKSLHYEPLQYKLALTARTEIGAFPDLELQLGEERFTKQGAQYKKPSV